MARQKTRPLQVHPDPARVSPGSPQPAANLMSEANRQQPSAVMESEEDEATRPVQISPALNQPISRLSQSHARDSKPRHLIDSPLTTCPHCDLQFIDMGVADIRDHVQSCLIQDDDAESASSGLSPPPLDEPPSLDDGEFMPPPYDPKGITFYPERRGDALANDENQPQIRLGQITDAEAFGLDSPEDLSYSQLFNRVDNAQQALVAYQDEWMELERFVKGHEAQGMGVGKEKEKEKELNEPEKGRVSNPRVPKQSMIGVGYQDQLEAYAYGFEHSPHPSLLGKQNPIKQRYSEEIDGRKLRMRTKSQKAAEAGMSTSSESEGLGQNGRPKRAVRNREGSIDSAAAPRNTNVSSRYNSEGPRSRQLKSAGTYPSGKRIGRPPKPRIQEIQQDEGAAAKSENNNGLHFPGLPRRKSKLFEQYPSDNEDSQGEMRETTELWDEDGVQQEFGARPENSSSNATRRSTGTSESQQSDDSDNFTLSLSRNRPRENTSDFEEGRSAKPRRRQKNVLAGQPLNADAFDDQLSQPSRPRVTAKSGNRSQGAQKGWIKRKNNMLNQSKEVDDQANTDGDVDSDASGDESVYPSSQAANLNKKPVSQIGGEKVESEKVNPPQKLTRAELSSKNQKAAWAKDDGTRRAKSSETMKRRWAIAKATGNTAGLVGKSKSDGSKADKGVKKTPLLDGAKKVKREIGQTAASRNMINRWKKKKAADMLGIKAPHIGRHKREKSEFSMTPEASSNTDMALGNSSRKRKATDDDDSEASGDEQMDSRYSESVSLPNPSPGINFDHYQSQLTHAALEANEQATLASALGTDGIGFNPKRQKLGADEEANVRSPYEAVSSPARSRGGRRKKPETVSDEGNAGEESGTVFFETPQSTKTRTSGRARQQVSAAAQSPQSFVGDTIRLEPALGRLESRKRSFRPNYVDEGSSAAENAAEADEAVEPPLKKMRESYDDVASPREPQVDGQFYGQEQSALKKNKGGRPKKISTSTPYNNQVITQGEVKIELDPAALLKEQKRAAKSAKMSAIAKGRWARGEMDNVAAKRKANNALKKAAKAAALLNQSGAAVLSSPNPGVPITTPITVGIQSGPETNTTIRKSARPKAQSAKSRLSFLMDGGGDSDSEPNPTKLTLVTPNSSHPRRKISEYEEFQQLASPLGSPLGRGKRPAALKAKQSFSRYGDESEIEFDDIGGTSDQPGDEAEREAEAEHDVDNEINRQFASEYDHYQALAAPGNEILLGKRVRKPVVNLREAMAIEAGEEDDDEFEV